MYYCFVMLTLVGLSESDMEPFVVNGKNASIKKFPHSALLSVSCKYSEHQDSRYWICGASILNDRVMMSAGHCLYRCSTGSVISVSVGHEQKNSGFMSSVSSFVVHRNHNHGGPTGDIALMRLLTELKYSDVVKRVAVMENPPYFEKAQLAGWGFIDEYRSTHTNILQYTNQQVWNTNDCLDQLGTLPVGTFCASNLESESYPSGGDSGSALMVRGYIQIGLVSYKVPSVSRRILVYTDVGYYYNWIVPNSNSLYCFNSSAKL